MLILQVVNTEAMGIIRGSGYANDPLLRKTLKFSENLLHRIKSLKLSVFWTKQHPFHNPGDATVTSVLCVRKNDTSHSPVQIFLGCIIIHTQKR
jgi:hypothetical protein